MARSLWTGSLSFGVVNVPVAMITAVRDQDLHFTQIHEKDGAPIEIHRICEKEDVEVPHEEITHGYDCDDGTQVIVSDLEVMGRTDRAALGQFVMRAKEYLALVRARDGVLTLTTMLFADEVRSTKDVDAATQKSHKPTPKQVNAAVAVIEELSTEWEPERYRDEYRKRLQAIVRRKRKGDTITVPTETKAPAPAPDLMDALERTLQEMTGKSGTAKKQRAEKQKA